MEWIIAALTMGLLGSFHCIGMCGPIALALPVGHFSRSGKIAAILVYNFGRVITYAFFGLLFGLIGQGFALAGFQQIMSIVIGSILLLVVLFPYSWSQKMGISKWNGWVNKIKLKLGLLFKQRSISALFSIGLLNGLLPCGLVYMAIAGSVAMADATKGSLFMSLFGLGTIPAMFTVTFIKDFISLSVRNKIQKAVPVFVAVMAILLILRGLNLGIPYVSPKVQQAECTTMSCCAKK
ncbi:MAG: sulfite exporter TauE/SafE family protein [Bacteroidia bacterium]